MFSKMSVMCLVMIWVECSAYNMIQMFLVSNAAVWLSEAP